MAMDVHRKIRVNNSLVAYRQCFPWTMVILHLHHLLSFKFIPLTTDSFMQSRPVPRLRSSRLSPLSEYKSNHSNLTNCDVYYREIIKQCVNAGKDDVVVFTGSGTTGAIHKLIHALQLTGKEVEKSVSTRN